MTRPLRILRIADVPRNPHGGMGKAMLGSGAPLKARGHQIDYWFDTDLRAPGSPKLRRFTVPPTLVRRVRQAQRAGRAYDVVEIHEPLAGAYTLARRLRSSGPAALPPCVVFSHGLEERRHAAELAYRQRVGLPVGLKRRFSPHTVIQQAKFAVRHAEHVLCCNHADRNHLIGAGVPAARLTAKPSGLDDAFLNLDETPLPDADQPAFLFLGSWVPRKGTRELIDAGQRLLAENPAATLTLAGVGAAGSEAQAAFAPAVRPRVHILPEVRGDQALIDLYRRHTALVLPSFYEGQPLVMLEAAAAGRPVVTTGICGMLDFIEDQVHGQLVPPGDAHALGAALIRLAQDRDLATRMGRAGRERAQQHAWQAVSRTVEHAYRAAIEVTTSIHVSATSEIHA